MHLPRFQLSDSRTRLAKRSPPFHAYSDSHGQRRSVFELSICRTLVNAISQNCLEEISSDLAHVSTLTEG